MLLKCGVGEDFWESLGLQGDQQVNPRGNQSCWSWNCNILTLWCEEVTLKAGGQGETRGWDDWMASPTRYTWVWASSGCWWWTEKPCTSVRGVAKGQTWLRNWTELNWPILINQDNLSYCYMCLILLNLTGSIKHMCFILYLHWVYVKTRKLPFLC